MTSPCYFYLPTGPSFQSLSDRQWDKKNVSADFLSAIIFVTVFQKVGFSLVGNLKISIRRMAYTEGGRLNNSRDICDYL
jgi:hypothetical protein